MGRSRKHECDEPVELSTSQEPDCQHVPDPKGERRKGPRHRRRASGDGRSPAVVQMGVSEGQSPPTLERSEAPKQSTERRKRGAGRVHDPNLALPQASDPKVALALKLVGARSALPRRPVEPVPAYHDDPAVDKQGRRLLKGLGLAVKLQRVERGWSQERLGSNSGLDRTYVGCIERGERNLGIANVALLARALQVSAAELLAEAERLAALLADDDA